MYSNKGVADTAATTAAVGLSAKDITQIVQCTLTDHHTACHDKLVVKAATAEQNAPHGLRR